MASANLQCGPHTATGVPGLRNRSVLVYSTLSDALLRVAVVGDVEHVQTPKRGTTVWPSQLDPAAPVFTSHERTRMLPHSTTSPWPTVPQSS